MKSINILAEADQCVKCGLCLPHCPTYQLTRDEGDSPRGRIALIQGLAAGELSDQRTHYHLARCLTCRNCETACPSGVKYAQLIDAARDLIQQQSRNKGIGRLGWLTRFPYQSTSHKLLALYQRSGLRTLARGLGGHRLRQLDDLLPRNACGQHWQEYYTPKNPAKQRVGLFLGCVTQITDHSALIAAIQVLNRLDIEVIVPPKQNCCGAMHLHNGAPAKAYHLAEGNRHAFAPYQLDAIVGLASGCTGQLLEYPQQGEALNAPIMDISRFLNQFIGVGQLKLNPLAKKVAIHTPCTEKNVLHSNGEPLKLLQQIPEIELICLQESGCCGAAGTHLLTQKALADELRQPLLKQLATLSPEILVTSNTGCTMHLRAGIEAQGLEIKVQHPIELLAGQLGEP